MKTSWRTGALCALLLTGGAARADEAGDQVLAKVDEAMNRASTQSIEYEVTNEEPGKPASRMGLVVRVKGDKRLTEFTAPADMKGTKVLVLSPTQMYVYLPAFGKVRRIASNVTGRGLMGMTFSLDDLRTRYGDEYTAAVASETATEWHLVATPKPGRTPTYGRIELTVARDRKLPTELKYFDAQGRHVKTETRSGYTCDSDVCAPGTLKMVDHATGGASTTMTRKAWKVNEPIPDDTFSKRALEK